jgi:hypothetical protein
MLPQNVDRNSMDKWIDSLAGNAGPAAQSSGGPIQCAVGELFRGGAAAPLEEFSEFLANLFVLFAGAFPVRIELLKQEVEGSLRDRPVFS